MRLRGVPVFLLEVLVIWASGNWFDGYEWRWALRNLEDDPPDLPEARLVVR